MALLAVVERMAGLERLYTRNPRNKLHLAYGNSEQRSAEFSRCLAVYRGLADTTIPPSAATTQVWPVFPTRSVGNLYRGPKGYGGLDGLVFTGGCLSVYASRRAWISHGEMSQLV